MPKTSLEPPFQHTPLPPGHLQVFEYQVKAFLRQLNHVFGVPTTKAIEDSIVKPELVVPLQVFNDKVQRFSGHNTSAPDFQNTRVSRNELLGNVVKLIPLDGKHAFLDLTEPGFNFGICCNFVLCVFANDGGLQHHFLEKLSLRNAGFSIYQVVLEAMALAEDVEIIDIIALSSLRGARNHGIVDGELLPLFETRAARKTINSPFENPRAVLGEQSWLSRDASSYKAGPEGAS
ncbi:hypothetical protein ONS95_005945 [Cadophora gregata]|uniref:uncharacterized protein n=1 Tax=Cadophora gregata TaxID=51156 RepID=UPI0026DB1FAC|nr:uncharacterized protein ONS95_005945 [Cadophora gregata]KAK0102322.1 hypothetical protein ONS95_005945 [Cadophora gregata]